MPDRELLELAAKASEIELAWDCEDRFGEPWTVVNGVVCAYWNPLTENDDALRLAVKCGICFGPNLDGDRAVAYGEDGRNIVELHGTDPYAATRRAITRAAAEIGRNMK